MQINLSIFCSLCSSSVFYYHHFLKCLCCIQAVEEVTGNYNKLSDVQRKFLVVNTNDIFLRFIYEIGMIFDDATRTFLLQFYLVSSAAITLSNSDGNQARSQPSDNGGSFFRFWTFFRV